MCLLVWACINPACNFSESIIQNKLNTESPEQDSEQHTPLSSDSMSVESSVTVEFHLS